jgi:hypothetical protein
LARRLSYSHEWGEFFNSLLEILGRNKLGAPNSIPRTKDVDIFASYYILTSEREEIPDAGKD